MDNKPGITFTIFRLTIVIVIAIESLLAVFHSLHSTTESHLGTILPWFAGLEVLAALLLLIPQTVKIGGAILLVIFAAALIVHGPAQQMPLFVYAAGVIFLMAHRGTNSRQIDPSGGGEVPGQ